MAILASLTLLVVDYRGSRLSALRALLSLGIYPLQSLASLPVDVFESVSGTVISYVELQKENRR
ncbi:MAG: rod shape-determining protein MreC, partial [Methylomonas sp.]